MPDTSDKSLPDFGILIDETQFWVAHRRVVYGSFDYQWSLDLSGVEFLYQKEKYGECCSDEEFYADLKPFQLPQKVSEVATVVTGTFVSCIWQQISVADRISQITRNLQKLGLERYQIDFK